MKEPEAAEQRKVVQCCGRNGNQNGMDQGFCGQGGGWRGGEAGSSILLGKHKIDTEQEGLRVLGALNSVVRVAAQGKFVEKCYVICSLVRLLCALESMMCWITNTPCLIFTCLLLKYKIDRFCTEQTSCLGNSYSNILQF